METAQATGMWTTKFSSQPATELDQAGGKGASLGLLTMAGLPVPPGFVLTTAAYQRYLNETGIEAQIAGRLEALDLYRLKHCEELSRFVADHTKQNPIPADIASELISMYKLLGGGNERAPVAVRSSATAEDLPTASFAGQLESFLDVHGTEPLLDAVQRCWASLWSPRAIHYRQQRGFPHLKTSIAVVIQQMVPADCAGVLFTAHPVTGRLDQLFIEAAPGLGEGVVSGTAAVDQFVLFKDSGELADQTVAPGRAAPVLTPVLLRELLVLARQVEQFYGKPQDIEWAVHADRVWLLQARPITTLANEPDDLPDDLPVVLPPHIKVTHVTSTTASMLSDRWTTAPTPFDLETSARGQEEGLFAMLAGEGIICPKFEDAFIARDGILIHVLPYDFRFSLRFVLNIPRIIVQSFRSDPSEWKEKVLPELDRKLSALESEAAGFPVASDEALLHVIDRVTRQLYETFESRRPYFFDQLARMVFDGLVKRAGKERAPGLQADLLAGIDHTSARIQHALAALAGSLRAEPVLLESIQELEPELFLQRQDALPGGEPFHEKLRAFLIRFGSRELYYGGPTWSEEPGVVINLLRSLAVSEPAHGGASAHGKDADTRVRQATEAVSASLPAFLRPLFRRTLKLARASEAFKEDSHFQLMRPIPVMRSAARELGRRLTERNLLAHPGDVFYVLPSELKQLVQGNLSELDRLAETVARRKRWLAAVRRRGLLVPLHFLPGSGDATVLRGTPVGRGQVTATARIIRSEADFGRLRSGEILVAPYTNPAWTPLFSLASGVVVDTGGTASHAAIVAREYDIPAVMGTRNATSVLNDGDLLTVDGVAGTVRVVQKAHKAVPMDL